jgi:MutS domain V
MKMLWAGNPIPIMKGGLSSSNADMFSARSIVQGAFMLFSFAQSLIQPIENARHLYRINRKILENGDRVIRLQKLYEDMKSEFLRLNISFSYRNSLNAVETDSRIAIHQLIEQPERFKITLREFAEFEILWKLARSPLLFPVEMLTTEKSAVFCATNLVDISLGPKGISSSFSFTGDSHHAVLTGPNGGGKSSFLRGVLQCCLLSHSYGVAPAEKLRIQKLSWISSGLCLQDNPGNLSMFESEVYFAANILKRTEANGIGMILYDELFHSTNPPDGIRTAEIFLKELWTRPFIASIVSTHVFELVESAPDSVQRLCCSAEERKNGLNFLYDVKPGVCRVSSVKSIWKRFGLVCSAGKSRSEKGVKKENPTK